MDIKIGEAVHIWALKGACQRTKNRIREHGAEGFIITGFDPGSWRFGNTPAVLLESVSKSAAGGEEWKGWLPLLEVDVKS